MTYRNTTICFVEDGADDRALLRQAFQQIPGCSLTLFASSEQFCRHIFSPETLHALPDLIVLDFNMPGTNGGELLIRLKRTPQVQAVPVAVYSTGMLPLLEEMLRSYGAEHCFLKPANGARMEQIAWDLFRIAASASVLQ